MSEGFLLYFYRGHRNGKIIQNGIAENDSLQVQQIMNCDGMRLFIIASGMKKKENTFSSYFLHFDYLKNWILCCCLKVN